MIEALDAVETLSNKVNELQSRIKVLETEKKELIALNKKQAVEFKNETIPPVKSEKVEIKTELQKFNELFKKSKFPKFPN